MRGQYSSTSKSQVRTQRIFELTNFMLQWFIKFPEFAEYIEFTFHMGTNSNMTIHQRDKIVAYSFWRLPCANVT